MGVDEPFTSTAAVTSSGPRQCEAVKLDGPTSGGAGGAGGLVGAINDLL